MLEKKYNVYKNEAFKGWFYNQQAQGYQSLVDLDEIAAIIYQFADAYTTENESFLRTNGNWIESWIEHHEKVLPLFQGYYRAKEIISFSKNSSPWIGLFLEDHYPDTLFHPLRPIMASSQTGEIKEITLERLDGDFKEVHTLEELLEKFQNEENCQYDYNELEQCVKNHDCDLKLRKQIFDSVVMCIIAEAKDFESGYQRVEHFVKDINDAIPDLNMSITEIGKEVQKLEMLQNKKLVKK